MENDQENINEKPGDIDISPVDIVVQDTDTLTVTSTFSPQDYIDSQQIIIDSSDVNINRYTQAIADRQDDIVTYQKLIAQEHTKKDSAQTNIDTVVKTIPELG